MSQRALKILAWSASILCCLYFAWALGSLFYFAKDYSDLYNVLNVKLPVVTGLLLATYRIMFPALFCAGSAWVVIKEIKIKNKWATLGITLAAAVAVFVAVLWFKIIIYYPVATFREKLN